jgi:hypothetical protein
LLMMAAQYEREYPWAHRSPSHVDSSAAPAWQASVNASAN